LIALKNKEIGNIFVDIRYNLDQFQLKLVLSRTERLQEILKTGTIDIYKIYFNYD